MDAGTSATVSRFRPSRPAVRITSASAVNPHNPRDKLVSHVTSRMPPPPNDAGTYGDSSAPPMRTRRRRASDRILESEAQRGRRNGLPEGVRLRVPELVRQAQ